MLHTSNSGPYISIIFIETLQLSQQITKIKSKMKILKMTYPCLRIHLNSELFELDIICKKLGKRSFSPTIIQFKDLYVLMRFQVLEI